MKSAEDWALSQTVRALAVLMAGIVVAMGIFYLMIWWDSKRVYEKSIDQALKTTEICEVLEWEQIVSNSDGESKIALVKRENGEVRAILLDDDLSNSPFHAIRSIPQEAKFVYITGLGVETNKHPLVVPILPSR